MPPLEIGFLPGSCGFVRAKAGMMNETGNALAILTTEVLTQLGQTVLQATVMTALMSALQWPLSTCDAFAS